MHSECMHYIDGRHATDCNILLNSFQRPAQIQYTTQSLGITALMFVKIPAYLIPSVNTFGRISGQNVQIRKLIFKNESHFYSYTDENYSSVLSFVFVVGLKVFYQMK